MKNKIWLMFKKEMREVFRDKKSLAMMLIIPFMIPLLIFGFSALFESEVNKPIEDYNRIGFAYELVNEEKEIIKSIGIEPTYEKEDKLKEMYEDGSIDLYVTKAGNTYYMNGKSNETTSYASNLVESYFVAYKTYLESKNIANSGLNPNDILDPIKLDANITEEDSFISSYIVVYAFMFIIMAITVSATYPSTDATAGEKERGTLETLLTFPIKSRDIIIGKYLSVTTSSMITGLLSLILMLFSLNYVNGAFKIFEGVNLMLSVREIALVVIIIILYSALISGLSIALASKAKSFKEAQGALTPLTFISFFPGMIAYMANISLTPALSLVPFLNFTMVFDDMISGNIDILNVILMFASTVVFIVIVLAIIIKQYKRENVLFSK